MKFRAILLSLLLTATLPAQARELIACGHPFYPPVSWAENGRITGLAAEVVHTLFTELGYEVRLDLLGNWKRCMREVRHGRADIVVAAYRIPSREAYLHFTKQHLIDDKVAVFINTRLSPSTGGLDELRGKTAGMLLGDTFGTRFDNFVQQHNPVEYVSRGEQNFAKLAMGRIDFMPLGLLSGNLQNQRLGYNDIIRPLDIGLDTEYYYLAVGHQSGLRRHLPYLTRRLSEMHRSGMIRRLKAKYSLDYLNSPLNQDQTHGEP